MWMTTPSRSHVLSTNRAVLFLQSMSSEQPSSLSTRDILIKPPTFADLPLQSRTQHEPASKAPIFPPVYSSRTCTFRTYPVPSQRPKPRSTWLNPLRAHSHILRWVLSTFHKLSQKPPRRNGRRNDGVILSNYGAIHFFTPTLLSINPPSPSSCGFPTIPRHRFPQLSQ